MTSVGIVGKGAGREASWSGIPSGLREGLAALGVDGPDLAADPSPAAATLIKPWLRLTGRLDPAWEHTGEMRRLAELATRARARRLAPPDGWVLLNSDVGLAVRGPVVLFEDMTVVQAVGEPGFYHSRGSTWTLRRWQDQQRSLYLQVRAVCTASSWARRSVIDDYGVASERVHVVGFGRNIAVPAVRHDWTTARFLFVGRDWVRKRGADVVRAFRVLLEEQPEARLDVVGDHPPLSEPSVTGHGPLDMTDESARRRLANLFAHATCFVLPSESEPFGIAYAEAGGAGVPSIGTTAGGAFDAIGPGGGVLVDPGDDRALLEAMRHMADPEVARAAGLLAAQRAALLTWPKVAARLVRALGLPVSGEPQEEYLPPSM